MQAVEESLTRLKTDYIDLYQVHVADPETPREETLRALDDLVRQGKVRALGEAETFATADDLNASQAIAAANGLTSFATMEANCSILVRDAEKAIIQRTLLCGSCKFCLPRSSCCMRCCICSRLPD